MREGMESHLRRLCGRIPAHLRLYVVLTMLLFFAFLANYVFFNGLYHIFPTETPKRKRCRQSSILKPLK